MPFEWRVPVQFAVALGGRLRTARPALGVRQGRLDGESWRFGRTDRKKRGVSAARRD
jgi:hypothetical protein